MSETRDTRDRIPSEPPGTAPATVEYQPPAIAWEEPLEAIAAASCALAGSFDCQLRPIA